MKANVFCSSWACGLVPVAETLAGNKNVLWTRAESIGLQYSGSSCCFERIDAPKGVQVTVFVDFPSKVCKFIRDGVVVAVKPVPAEEFPLRLGICGHSGCIFHLKQNEAAYYDALIAAQVGDSVHSFCGSPQASLPLAQSHLGKGGSVFAASEKSVKQLTRMRMEFSSAREFDLWRRALLHAHPSLNMEPRPCEQHSQAASAAQDNVRRLSLPLSFVPDARPLCQERYVYQSPSVV